MTGTRLARIGAAVGPVEGLGYLYAPSPGCDFFALPPDKFNRLANQIGEKIAKVSQPGTYPAVVVPSPRRRFVRSVVSARGLANPVISYEEIGGGGRPAIVGVVAA